MKRSSFLIASLVAGSFAYSGGAAAQADSVEAGEKLYNSTCVACHGADGKGKLPGVPDFTKSDGRLTKSDDVLVTNIMEGFKSPGSSMAMPAKGGISSLTKEQAEAMAAPTGTSRTPSATVASTRISQSTTAVCACRRIPWNGTAEPAITLSVWIRRLRGYLTKSKPGTR